MPTPGVLLTFALASLLLAVAPGPSILLLLAVGADRGRGAGLATAVGLAAGTFTWVLVTAAGLGALLAAQPGLLSVITALGGAYLLWLGIDRFRAARQDATEQQVPDAARDPTPGPGRHRPAQHRRHGPALRDGLVVNLLNPSLAIFLASIVPPFLDPARAPVWQQVLALGTVLAGVSTVVNIGWGLLGAAVGRRVRRWVGSPATATAVGVAYTALAAVAFAAAVLR